MRESNKTDGSGGLNSGDNNGKENKEASYAAHSKLGQKTSYFDQYNPDLLDAIERSAYRSTVSHKEELNEKLAIGMDIWHAYELSFLNLQGLPQVCIARISLPANSPRIVESKSLKLYLNSFSQTKFEDQSKVAELISKDLELLLAAPIVVEIFEVGHGGDLHGKSLPSLVLSDDLWQDEIVGDLAFSHALLLDDLAVSCELYQPSSELLSLSETSPAKACFVSHLLRSNCPVTSQPDWGSLYIAYDGVSSSSSDDSQVAGLSPESLLKYIVSYREHNGFHEQTVEQIFADLLNLGIERLFVCAQYTRRGGIDINPIRTTGDIALTVPRVNRL